MASFSDTIFDPVISGTLNRPIVAAVGCIETPISMSSFSRFWHPGGLQTIPFLLAEANPDRRHLTIYISGSNGKFIYKDTLSAIDPFDAPIGGNIIGPHSGFTLPGSNVPYWHPTQPAWGWFTLSGNLSSSFMNVAEWI